MKFSKVLCCLILAVLICGSVSAQSWESGINTGVIGVDYSRVESEYTIVLHNLTGIPGDKTANYDILVWTLELFNLPSPDTIISKPDGWVWTSRGFEMFEIENSQDKYYTPPALAPGASYTFKYQSTSQVPANPGGPADGSPGFLCHVAAVDSSDPGDATKKWKSFTPAGMSSPTWHERVEIPEVPEPGSLLALASGLIGAIGIAGRRRK